MPDLDNLHNKPIAPKNATVGDENLKPRDVEVEVVNEDVPAQVMGPPAEAVDTVKVSETYVQMDEVITDPSSPLAVQLPDAGKGSLDLPIHQLARAKKPEEQFADAAAEAEKEERAAKAKPSK